MEFRGENFLSDLCGREDNKAEPVLENKFLSDLCGREVRRGLVFEDGTFSKRPVRS